LETSHFLSLVLIIYQSDKLRTKVVCSKWQHWRPAHVVSNGCMNSAVLCENSLRVSACFVAAVSVLSVQCFSKNVC